ncbi:tetratricopeptide repeat protein, partial [Nitrospinae bacterium AH_259_B05_G02_I21]|nr:tetratricopeptide repeat protein [Nitrospinae bacterium AH_259_B05_G02_I21]
MRRSKRLVSASNLTIPLTVVVGLSLCSITLAQEKPWMTLNQEAHQLYQQGKHQEGVKVAKEALSVAEKIFGTDSPVAAISLNNLAQLYRAQGNDDEAKKLLARAKGTPAGSTVLAQEARWKALYNQVGGLYQQGKYREAIPLAKEALKVAKQTFGQNHP